MMDGVTAVLEPMHIILPRLSEGKHGLQIFTNDQRMIHLSHVINLTFGSFESLTTRSWRLFSLPLPFEMCLVKKNNQQTKKKYYNVLIWTLPPLCVINNGWMQRNHLDLETDIDSVTRSDALPDDNSSLTAAVWHLQVRLDQSRVKSASYVISTRSWHKKTHNHSVMSGGKN